MPRKWPEDPQGAITHKEELVGCAEQVFDKLNILAMILK